MAVLDEDIGAALTQADGNDAGWSFPASVLEQQPRDWRSLYERQHARAERERARADAAEARCEELRRSDVDARSRAGSFKWQLDSCRGKLEASRVEVKELEEREEEINPPKEARVCSCCGKPYAAIGADISPLVEIDVKAHKRVIRRPRWRRACGCASSPIEVSAPPVPRLFRNTPYGISVWACVLFERYACYRPLKRVAAWLRSRPVVLGA